MLAAALALQACASPPRAPGAAPVAPASAGPASAGRRPGALATERDWLRAWFEGTPVLITQPSDDALTVDVPLAFSFDARRSAVKPALGAVLDKLAESLRRTGARLPGLAAPADPGGPPQLALQRASAVRAHLLSRGVHVSQLGSPAAASGSTVQLLAAPGVR
jgi:outer membrane protein OmpA-like peptidoglycan-associated protein